ncbi:phage protein, BRO family [Pseudomonas protegens Pf-5]|nr:phage protein, BRO family [Pseudomonas protegens Pf-5]
MANHSTNVISFNFGKQQVRTLLIDDQPWFVAADVCVSLAIGNVSLAVNGRADRETDGLDEDEKGIATVNTPSGAQEMLVVNESGLYALIFKSRKAEAKRFKKWVTAEVLPAIRKHGRYEDQGKMAILLDELIGMSELNVIKGLIRDKAKAVPPSKQQSFSLTMHNRLHTRFSVPRTELIPASQFEQACNFIGGYSLEGEYLERENTALNTLTDKELYDVFFLMHHFLAVKRIYDSYQLDAALRMLRSGAGIEMLDHFRDSMMAVSTLQRRLPDMEAAAVRIGHRPGTVMGRAAA